MGSTEWTESCHATNEARYRARLDAAVDVLPDLLTPCELGAISERRYEVVEAVIAAYFGGSDG